MDEPNSVHKGGMDEPNSVHRGGLFEDVYFATDYGGIGTETCRT